MPASIWATAHYTQFTNIETYRYTLVDAKAGGCGTLVGGGTYVSLLDTATGDFTLIVEKQPGSAGDVAAETATFSLAGRFANATTLAVWSTRLSVGGALASPSEQFEQLPSIRVAGDAFSIDVDVGQILTVTTLLGAGNKGSFGACARARRGVVLGFHPSTPPTLPPFLVSSARCSASRVPCSLQ